MGKNFDPFVLVMQLIIVAVLSMLGYVAYDGLVNRPVEEAAKQAKINAFYLRHKCGPEGYVTTKSSVIRTYRCDNGLFIARDMEE